MYIPPILLTEYFSVNIIRGFDVSFDIKNPLQIHQLYREWSVLSFSLAGFTTINNLVDGSARQCHDLSIHIPCPKLWSPSQLTILSPSYKGLPSEISHWCLRSVRLCSQGHVLANSFTSSDFLQESRILAR
jgi:hypothetical protein